LSFEIKACEPAVSSDSLCPHFHVPLAHSYRDIFIIFYLFFRSAQIVAGKGESMEISEQEQKWENNAETITGRP
jgi:hypothetical protein